MITPNAIILLSWAAFLIVWVVSAFNVKSDVRGGFWGAWKHFWLLRFVAAALLIFLAIRVTSGTSHYTSPIQSIFSGNAFTQFPALGWTAATLTVIGVAIAIWARVNLGRNWSSHPTRKVDHELVTSGPYAYVRHPIYTGVILMAFATALSASIFGVFIFIIASLVFISRIHREEKIMLELFPNQYPEYQKRTKRLVPFVW